MEQMQQLVKEAGGRESSGGSPEASDFRGIAESERALRIMAERERDAALAKLAQVRNVVL